MQWRVPNPEKTHRKTAEGAKHPRRSKRNKQKAFAHLGVFLRCAVLFAALEFDEWAGAW
jgi:hypothetical protein